MRSPETYFIKGYKRCRLLPAALVVAAIMGCLFNPVAAETFPTNTTKIQLTKLLYDYDVVASWRRIDSSQSADIGLPINKIEVGIMISSDYASTSEAVIANTRVHATITSPDNVTVFAGFLNDIGWMPGNIDGAWGLSRLQHFTGHVLAENTYTIIVVYEILIGTTWTHVDTATHYLTCTVPEDTPDIPTDVEPSAWLPIMLSFAIIIGMAFIGLNLSPRGPDPVPVLFMLFVGIVLTWTMGWLPTWIFVTAIALVSMLSAALWGKLFGRK